MSNRSSLELSTRSVKIYSGAADAQARADIAEHVADVANPHDVTAEQVGLGLVDNTSDADKPVSGPQAAALALKAPLVSPALSGIPTAPTAPLGTASDQVATTAFAQAAANAVGNDVGEVGADLENHLADHANPHAVTKAQVGLALVDNTADAAKPVSGPQQTAINVATAAASAAQADIDGHQLNVSNPHSTTKAQVGLGSVDNTADLAKPVSTAQQTAINVATAAAGAAQADIDGHEANLSNPHGTTKAQLGLGNVDNTADVAKPVSSATQTALDLKAPLISPALTGAPSAPTAAPGTATTQIATTAFAKTAVDASAATLTAALALKAPLASPALTGVPTAPTAAPGTSSAQLATTAFADAIGDGLTANLAAHTGNTANPHGVTKAQVGLGSVDNTSDLAKPVSTAQQTAISAAAAIGTAAQADIDGHQANVSNPHSTTKAQVGLGSVDNTADLAKPVSSATQTALNLKAPLLSPALTGTPTAPTAAPGTSTTQLATTAFAKTAADGVGAGLSAHEANVANPHGVTKAQVGLGSVDNTSDLAKPVSTAQQTALALKAPLASPALSGVPTAPTAAPGTSTTQVATTAFADAIGDGLTASLAAHTGNLANPHGVTKSQVGLANVDNTNDMAKPISTAQAAALALKAPLASPSFTGVPLAPTAAPGTSTTQVATTAFADAIGDGLTANLAAHTGNTANPHGVTKAQVGLGSVDNTSDAAKPVSTAQAAALALKAPLASPALTGVPTAPTAPAGTRTTQVATTAFAEAISDELLADLDGLATSPERPGDAVALYGTLSTGTAAAMPRVDPAWVATSAAGQVVRVDSALADDPQVIAPAGAFGLESGHVYDLRFRVQRQTDPIDPLNDSVTLAIRWLTNTKAGVAGAGGISTIANLPLVIAGGVTERTARIGGGGLVPPAGAVYFRPYVQMFGNAHLTDVIVIGVVQTCLGIAIVQAITGTTALPAGAAGLVLVNAAAPATVTMPPSPVLGQTLTIKDAAGNAATRNITLAGGGPNIEGAATMVISFNYGWAQLVWSGSQWVQV